MNLNTCNFIKRIEQVLAELDISAIEEYVIIIINQSFTEGRLPEAWKVAKIVPIPKKI